MDVLIDTSFLFATLYTQDKYHELASSTMLGKLKSAKQRG